MKKVTKALKWSAAGLSATAAILLLSEACLRLCGFTPLFDHDMFAPSACPGLVYSMEPGYKGHFSGVRVELNGDGLRDREFDRGKSEGAHRIVVLGDSITFGQGIKAEEAFPAVLESMLAGKKVRVMNFGVPGYNVEQKERLVHCKAVYFKPDVIIIEYNLGDEQPPLLLLTERGLSPSQGLTLLPDALRKAVSRSAALSLLRQGANYIRTGRELAGAGDIRFSLRKTDEAFRRLEDSAEHLNIRIYALFVPMLWRFKAGNPFSKLETEVEGLARTNELGFIRALKGVDNGASDIRRLWASRIDWHPGPEAHRMIAADIFAALSDETAGWH